MYCFQVPTVPELTTLNQLLDGTGELRLLIPDLYKLTPSAKLLLGGCKKDARLLRLRVLSDLLWPPQSGHPLSTLSEVAKTLGFQPAGPIASQQPAEQQRQQPTGVAPMVPGLPLGSLLESETLWGDVAWMISEFFPDPVSRNNSRVLMMVMGGSHKCRGFLTPAPVHPDWPKQ